MWACGRMRRNRIEYGGSAVGDRRPPVHTVTRWSRCAACGGGCAGAEESASAAQFTADATPRNVSPSFCHTKEKSACGSIPVLLSQGTPRRVRPRRRGRTRPAAYARSVSTSSAPASSCSACGPLARTNASRACLASASLSARFAFATEIMSLMRLSWFTSDAPGS